MDKFIIIDWANNHCYPQMEFDTFEDGWDWIYANVEDIDSSYDDLYVIDKYSWIPNFSKYPKFER